MSAPTYDLGTLHGGLRLDAHKQDSTAQPIRRVPVPAELVLPLTQHAGENARPVVAVGDTVFRGQVIADCGRGIGAPVHASSSGEVVAIEPRPVPHRQGGTDAAIVIRTDGRDEPARQHDRQQDRHPNIDSLDPGQLLATILEGGVVGLGGAAFPTAQKLLEARAGTLDTLILNGVECEPYISCDDALMRERAREVIGGARILLHALSVDTAYVAVESDKPEAIRQLAAAIGESADERLVLKQVPAIYPSGGEDQLVQLVTHREVPSRGLPADVGCLVQNVGTAAAVYDQVIGGRPLISRITTVTGDGVVQPMNVEARLGTTVADVVAFAGGYTDRAAHLVLGGSMTGKSMSTDRIPVVKATNCILVLSGSPAGGPERPCIRCAECAEVCPVRLLPQQLHWYARADDEAKLRDYGLTDCIECGCCDLVCPSRIPLTAGFRQAKRRIREFAEEKARAERARRRFEARAGRLARETAEREREIAGQKEAARKAGAGAIREILRRGSGNADGHGREDGAADGAKDPDERPRDGD